MGAKLGRVALFSRLLSHPGKDRGVLCWEDRSRGCVGLNCLGSLGLDSTDSMPDRGKLI